MSDDGRTVYHAMTIPELTALRMAFSLTCRALETEREITDSPDPALLIMLQQRLAWITDILDRKG